MKRRNFLGFLGGAAVAGPGMAKAAASKMAEDLALRHGSSMLGGFNNLAPMGMGEVASGSGGSINAIVRANDMLRKIMGMTAAERAKHKARMHVGALDPDLANYRSLSIGARMDMQRERNLERHLNERRGMWERLSIGQNPYDDDPL